MNLNIDSIDTLIFDLGGVFIRLTGVSKMMEWTHGRFTVDQLWEIWFNSDHVKRFETGIIDSRSFAFGIIREYGMDVDESEFLKHFTSWASEMFPGAHRLLTRLKRKYTLVSLSNTNPIHWDILCDRFRINQFFHHNFPSHVIGRVKPEIDTFNYVLSQLESPPERIIFFDDNVANISTAKQSGIHAFRVEGVDGLNEQLNQLNMVEYLDSELAPDLNHH